MVHVEVPDLTLVDQAFGDFADLYSDILRVSVVATHEQIQLAYFDRRSELFTLLAKLDSEKYPTETSTEQRLGAERKMDAVVLAVRVLGDADTRLWYDQQRQERLMNRRRAAHGQLPGHSPDRSGRVVTSLDSVNNTSMEEGGLQGQQHAAADPNRDPNRERTTPSRRKKSRSEQLKSPRHHNHHHKKSKKKGSSRSKEQSSSSSSDKKLAEQKEHEQQQQQQQEQHEQEQQEESSETMRSKETEDTEHMTDDDDSGRHGTRTRTTTTTRTARGGPQEQRQDQEDTQDGGESIATDLECASLISSPSQKDAQKGNILSVITNSRILKNISEELSGACEDALVSVDQVFNAFTLTDKDIRAVTKRIDRAKKQFDH